MRHNFREPCMQAYMVVGVSEYVVLIAVVLFVTQ